jgi:membrane protein YdbS with pleckstrin-like domain
MTTDKRADDPAQRDLAWVGYDPRAMAPAIALAVTVTALVLWGRWALEDLSAFADRVGGLAVFALAWAVWPGLFAVFLYRTVSYTYRLTDRSVLVDFGFLARPVSPILFVEVVGVAAGGGWLTRWLGVGWVEVRTADRSVRMTGVRKPVLFAEKIRVARAAARPET